MTKRHSYFFKHLVVSLFALSITLLAIFYFWYSIPLMQATGSTIIFAIILCTDIIIGPILSFLIYKENKKSLKFDLSVVVLIQVIALIVGLWAVEKGRPMWLVFNVDRFEVVKKNEIIVSDLDNILPQFRYKRLVDGPQIVGIDQDDTEQQSQDLFQEVFDGISPAQKLERYIPIENVQHKIKQRSQDLTTLFNFNSKNTVDSILEKYPEADAWIPLKANHQDMVILLNKEQAKIIQIVNLRPWA